MAFLVHENMHSGHSFRGKNEKFVEQCKFFFAGYLSICPRFAEPNPHKTRPKGIGQFADRPLENVRAN